MNAPSAIARHRMKKFKKLDMLTRAVALVLLKADPGGMGKISKRIDEFSIEAKEIVKAMRTTSGLSAFRCQIICQRVCTDYLSEKDVSSCKQWSEVGSAIFWLWENDGKWEI